MNDQKYYTPEISEFHIGFEYEYTMDDYSRYLDRTNKDEWKKQTFHAGGNDVDGLETDNISSLLDKYQVRVKYLDEQDLIDLGFSEYKKEEDMLTGKPITKFLKKEEAIWFNSGIYFYVTIHGPDYITLEYQYYSSWENPHGKIPMRIKNKSELQRLLTQFRN